MIKNILLFGGTFDPVHNGHLALLKNAYELVHPELTLIIPTRLPPYKGEVKTAADIRVAMCGALVSAVPNARIEETELLRNGPSYTIDTVMELRQSYKGARLYFCIGSDMLLYFTHWKSWQALLSMVTLVVQSRTDADMSAVHKEAMRLAGMGGRVLLTKALPVEISSTFLRQRLLCQGDIDGAVPPEVALIINENNLYKGGN